MVQAYILIQTEVGKARDVAAAIAESPASSGSTRSPGRTTWSCSPRRTRVDELGKMIVSKVQLVPGITRTLTCSVVHL